MATTINAGTATSGAAISADATGILELQSGSTPTTAATIDASQNVGIGTNAPAVKLHVNKGSVGEAVRFTGSTDNARSLTFNSSSEGGFDGATWQRNILSSGGNHTWAVNSTERMRIDSSGDLLVGRTTALAGTFNSSNSQGLEVQSTGKILNSVSGTAPLAIKRYTNTGQIVEFWYNLSQVGNISVTASATSYVTSSDYRLKENIAPMTGALAKVQSLKPVTYKWKADGSDGQGFIAHELAEVVPDCVTGEKDAVDAEGKPVYQGIDTSFLVATLTAAIQELNAKLDAQAAEIAVLKGVA
jgi:hypothetical protein